MIARNWERQRAIFSMFHSHFLIELCNELVRFFCSPLRWWFFSVLFELTLRSFSHSNVHYFLCMSRHPITLLLTNFNPASYVSYTNASCDKHKISTSGSERKFPTNTFMWLDLCELGRFICLGWGCGEPLVSAESSSSALRTRSGTDAPATRAPTRACRLPPPSNSWGSLWAVQRASPMTSPPVARWQRSNKVPEVVLDSSRAADPRSFLEAKRNWKQWSDEINEIITDRHYTKTPDIDFLAVLLAGYNFRCPGRRIIKNNLN